MTVHLVARARAPLSPARLHLGFVAYYEELLGVWQRRLGNRHDAEDVAQEAMLRAMQADAAVVHEPRAYLHRTARNVATDALRRHSIADAAAPSLAIADAGSLAHDPENACYAGQLEARFLQALGELPLKCRQVFVWQRLDGLSQAEIAERLGLGKNSVEKYMIRAVRHLRDRLVEDAR